MNPTKAVLPVAGKGTRLLPLTLETPKCMLLIAGKPMIHYAVDEVLDAGIKEVVIVANPEQKSLKAYIEARKKKHWPGAKFRFAWQKNPHGNGDAILAAQKFIRPREYFLAAFPDNVYIKKEQPSVKTVSAFLKTKSAAVLLEKVALENAHKFGIVKIKNKPTLEGLCEISDLEEKPKNPPSDLAIMGRYVLPYQIFDCIKKFYPYAGTEIGLTQALKLYAQENNLAGLIYQGRRFDCGSLEGLHSARTYFSPK